MIEYCKLKIENLILKKSRSHERESIIINCKAECKIDGKSKRIKKGATQTDWRPLVVPRGIEPLLQG